MAAADIRPEKPHSHEAGPVACSVHGTATQPDQNQFLVACLDKAHIEPTGEQNKGIVQLHREAGAARAGQAGSFHTASNSVAPANSVGESPARFRFRSITVAKEFHRLDAETEGFAREGASKAVIGAGESADR